MLSRANIQGAVLDATMDMDERRRVFGEFEEGVTDLIARPKLLR